MTDLINTRDSFPKRYYSIVKYSNMLNIGFIFTDEKKNALRNYKYTGEDHSLFAPFMYKIWAIFFILVPKKISPNLVTIFGLSAVLFAFTIIHLDKQENDAFNCLIFAIALFIYQTADALDGMQGKRVHMYENATTEVSSHFFLNTNLNPIEIDL